MLWCSRTRCHSARFQPAAGLASVSWTAWLLLTVVMESLGGVVAADEMSLRTAIGRHRSRRQAPVGDSSISQGVFIPPPPEQLTNEPDWVKSIRAALPQLVTIECMPKHMRVKVDRLGVEKLGIPDGKHMMLSEPVCNFDTKIKTPEKYTSGAIYDLCKTETLHKANVIAYQNKLVLNINVTQLHGATSSKFFNLSEVEVANHEFYSQPRAEMVTVNQTFQCRRSRNASLTSINNDQMKNIKLRMTMSRERDSSANLFTYPTRYQLNSQIFVRLSVENKTGDPVDPDLQALPVSCYLSNESDPYVSLRAMHMLINYGCSSDRQTDDVLGDTFAFSISHSYFNRRTNFVHCNVTVCSQSGDRERDGFIRCPQSKECHRGITPADFKRIHTTETQHIYLGPLILVPSWSGSNSQESEDTQPGVFSGAAGLGMVAQDCCDDNILTDRRPIRAETGVSGESCPPCVSYPSIPGSVGNPQSQTVVNQGMGFSPVFGIAVASFFTGVLLIGAIWIVHRRTDPKKHALKKSRDSSETSSADSALLSTPTGLLHPDASQLPNSPLTVSQIL